ncbi:WD repeat-containing protein 11 [Iris pallida]|uniref:WD repeat-containing protein 11 n=1 Tax=Iris pallida TaxID=29817 RepID=A0AAX6GBX2_IRIPA|nr:WD repeat-containing protein 11 [Iris pallida]
MAQDLTPAAVGAQRGGEPGSADCRRRARRAVERMRRTRSARLGPWSGERQQTSRAVGSTRRGVAVTRSRHEVVDEEIDRGARTKERIAGLAWI